MQNQPLIWVIGGIIVIVIIIALVMWMTDDSAVDAPINNNLTPTPNELNNQLPQNNQFQQDPLTEEERQQMELELQQETGGTVN